MKLKIGKKKIGKIRKAVQLFKFYPILIKKMLMKKL